MGIVFMLVNGAVLGWLATVMVGSDETTYGLQLNIIGGIVGSFFAGLIVSPAIGAGSFLAGRYNVSAVIVSMVGAAALLLPLNLMWNRIVR